MTDFKVVIPARHGSTRLPGKPLMDIQGKPMVVHVAEQAAASGAADIWVATDHQDIARAVSEAGFNACMTRTDHHSGTDRLAEVAQQRGWSDDTIVVNVQGDEPLMPVSLIQKVASHLSQHPECAIATACHPLHNPEELQNPNVVKVVLDQHQNALYFSRAPIPFARDWQAQHHNSTQSLPADLPVLRHIGLYAYRCHFLNTYHRLQPVAIEQFEALEQLRALFYGYRIGVAITQQAPPAGVDTAKDLDAVRQHFASQ